MQASIGGHSVCDQPGSLSLPSSPHRPGDCELGQEVVLQQGASPARTQSGKSEEFLGGLEIVGSESHIYAGGISLAPRVRER